MFTMFTVVLVEPESDGNIGFVCRAMKNFCLKDLMLVKPKAPLCDEIKAYSMHGYDVYMRSKIENSLECLKRFDVIVGFTANVKYGAKILRDPVPARELGKNLGQESYRNVALVFGRESCGLTNEELAMCDIVSTIPADSAYPTLNLSHAVSIVLYELFLEKHEGSTKFVSPATRRRLVDYFNRLVDAESFKNPDSVKIAFNRITAKSNMTEKEAKCILALFSKLLSREKI